MFGNASVGSMTSTASVAPDGTGSSRIRVGLLENVQCSINPNNWSDSVTIWETNPGQYYSFNDTIGNCVWTCAGQGSVTGSYLTQYSATFTASAGAGPATVTATVSGLGKWNAATAPLTFTVIALSGEVTTPFCWPTNFPWWSAFHFTLQPLNVCFANITVKESTAKPGNDQCYVSTVPPGIQQYTALLGGIGGGNTWSIGTTNMATQDDGVGWPLNSITWYRANGRAPCGTTLYQSMSVVQGSSGVYKLNELDLWIYQYANELQNSRDTCTMSTFYP